MNYNIRKNQKSDITFIKKLLNSYFCLNIPKAKVGYCKELEETKKNYINGILERISKEEIYGFIALEGKKKLGFCLVEDVIEPYTGQKELYIINLSVIPEVMGKKVSNGLLRYLEEIARKKGIKFISAEINSENRRSYLLATFYFNYKVEKVTLYKKLF